MSIRSTPHSPDSFDERQRRVLERVSKAEHAGILALPTDDPLDAKRRRRRRRDLRRDDGPAGRSAVDLGGERGRAPSVSQADPRSRHRPRVPRRRGRFPRRDARRQARAGDDARRSVRADAEPRSRLLRIADRHRAVARPGAVQLRRDDTDGRGGARRPAPPRAHRRPDQHDELDARAGVRANTVRRRDASRLADAVVDGRAGPPPAARRSARGRR